MIRRVLTKGNWNVIEAEHGLAAITRLKDGEAPDLIILDLLMPEMDGFEFLSHLRSDARWQRIPVVVLTAKSLTSEDRQRLSGAATRLLQKGGDSLETLLTVLDEVVPAARGDRPAAGGAGER